MAGVWVFYYIQGEAGESEKFLNAVKVKSPNHNITLAEFLTHLPKLDNREQKLHCRFRISDDISGYVWQDISDPTAFLPEYNDMICAKLLNLSNLSNSLPTLLLKNKSLHFNSVKMTSKIDFAQSQIYAAKLISDSPNMLKHHNVSQIKSRSVSPSHNSLHGKAHETSPMAQSSAVPKICKPTKYEPKILRQSDLLNFGSESQEKSDAKYTGKSLYVQKQIEERVAKIEENVQQAIQTKKDRDASLIKQQEEFDEAKQLHDGKLTTWAEDHGRKRNIRTLLSTMDTVLWDDSRWKPIGIGDILEPNKVKMAYRRAMLVVHPDKCSEQSNEYKFIAKRIFEALNEAWKEFSEKEL